MENNQNLDESKSTVRDLLFHVDQIFHQRVNFLLLSETIFITAFATFICSKYFFMGAAICILGFLFTFYLNWTLIRHNTGISWLANKYRVLDKTNIYQEFYDIGKIQPQKIHKKIDDILPKLKNVKLGSFTIFVYILPAFFMIFWFVSFLYSIRELALKAMT